LINYIFTVAEGEPVYPIMDYKSGETAVYIFLAIFLFILGACMSIWIQASKKCMYHQLKRRRRYFSRSIQIYASNATQSTNIDNETRNPDSQVVASKVYNKGDNIVIDVKQ
jgi:hypothetical protein